MPNRRNVYLHYHPDEVTRDQIDELSRIGGKFEFKIVKDHKDANIIVSIGGDGAFLQAVRKTGFRDDVLYAGITTPGEHRLYSDFSLQGVEQSLDTILESEIEVRRYPLIDVMIDGHTSFKCLNELSIRSSNIKTFVIDVFIDNLHFETFRGDGMIIATPTGSTAYNKSINGAVVDPLLPCMQVSELASLNNNRYRTLGSSFILSGRRALTLKLTDNNGGNDFPIIGMDNEALGIQHIDEIKVELSDRIIKTVKLKNNSFWEKVKRTFL
ncbi:NAD kinase [Bacillus marinisedimentorum]|uniref:NAD kinase n=1 Tax=Bacillus marinisedimentorum TaxID=1821260 RepID=UPI0007DE7532|nr:NAD kinase [Bacillus marinisedimentorum]